MTATRHRYCGSVFVCADCKKVLSVRNTGLFGGGLNFEWVMLKDRVWQQSQRKGACRFLCVGCLESRIGRNLSAADFRRGAKVNFGDNQRTQSIRLRRRMRGLKPAKRLIETTFAPSGAAA
jgi:hypothetical protein